jgi:hypothetical protein
MSVLVLNIYAKCEMYLLLTKVSFRCKIQITLPYGCRNYIIFGVNTTVTKTISTPPPAAQRKIVHHRENARALYEAQVRSLS